MRAWKVGRLFGIDIFIHWTFLLLPLWVVMSQGEGAETPLGTFGVLAILFAIFGCVVLHELGHALTARLFGIGTKDITLYPIGGVARMERMSEKPWEEFWIAVGGPAVNVVIALLLFGVVIPIALVNPGVLFFASGLPTALGMFLIGVLMGNIFLVLFNMVPAFPMDGGRVFRSILSAFLGHLNATRIAAAVGAVVAIVGSGLFFMWTGNPWVLIVAFFVVFAGQAELRYVEWKHQQERAQEEPVELYPVHNWHFDPTDPSAAPQPRATSPLSGFYFPPKVAVYVWDSRQGVWIREPKPQMPAQ